MEAKDMNPGDGSIWLIPYKGYPMYFINKRVGRNTAVITLAHTDEIKEGTKLRHWANPQTRKRVVEHTVTSVNECRKPRGRNHDSAAMFYRVTTTF